MSKWETDWFTCPVCGEAVQADALACPHCGADEQTGWSQDTAYDDVDLPDSREPLKVSGKKQLMALLMLVGMALFLLRMFGVL